MAWRFGTCGCERATASAGEVSNDSWEGEGIGGSAGSRDNCGLRVEWYRDTSEECGEGEWDDVEKEIFWRILKIWMKGIVSDSQGRRMRDERDETSDPYLEGFNVGYLWHFWSKRLLGFLPSMIDIPGVVEGRSIHGSAAILGQYGC